MFVINDARKENLASLKAFIDAVAARGPDRYSLSDLLKAIGSADNPTTPSSADLQFALDRRTPPLYLFPVHKAQVEIDGIGLLENTVR